MPAAIAPPFAARLGRKLRESMPSGHAWWLVVGGCALGAALFALVWVGRSSPDDLRNPESVRAAADGALVAPLPAPLPAGEGARAFDNAQPAPDTKSPVRIEAHVPQAVPPGPAGVPADTPQASARSAAAADLPSTLPRPVTMPRPDYPRASLRRGEQGEVLLLVKVGANGRVDDIEVLASSQHRRLDRAAVSAVRRWRFEPAQRDGQAVAGELRVPIAFAPASN